MSTRASKDFVTPDGAIFRALQAYQDRHPAAQIDAFRTDAGTFRLRIIDPDFTGMLRTRRGNEVREILKRSPQTDESVTMLLLLTPEETHLDDPDALRIDPSAFDADENNSVPFRSDEFVYRKIADGRHVFVTVGRLHSGDGALTDRWRASFKIDNPPGIINLAGEPMLSVDIGEILRDKAWRPLDFNSRKEARDAAFEAAMAKLERASATRVS